MDDNFSIFLIMAVAMMAAVALIIGTTWIRARTRNAALTLRASEDAGRIGHLNEENEALRGQVGRLEDRLHALERIAEHPAREIESQRHD